MVDVSVSSQLQQWTFDKPALTRPERASSAASSPDLYHTDPDTLRIDTAVVEEAAPQSLEKRESVALQERYMSSEEDLSPMEGSGSDTDYDDDDVVIYELEKEVYSARKMSVQPLERGKTPDMAVMVSYMSVGRPKVIELANATTAREPNQRSASLAQLPISTINKLRKAEQPHRRSLAISQVPSRSSSPAFSIESRRPSTGHAVNTAPVMHSSSASFQTGSSIRSVSPSDIPTRPTTSSAPRPLTRSRTSIFFGSKTNLHSPATTTPFPPLTPISPDSHSFLSSDPYENSTTNAASPIIKSAPHRRLRSISQKLTLAKLAISSPTTKKRDSRISSRPGNMPPTPATPYTPLTPLTAPPMTTSYPSPMKSRRESRVSRPTTARNSQEAIDSIPQPLKRSNTRMVARGASDREPTIEIPPCPEDLDLDPMSSIKARRLKKRKSLMDLL